VLPVVRLRLRQPFPAALRHLPRPDQRRVPVPAAIAVAVQEGLALCQVRWGSLRLPQRVLQVR
jgi:hypothetical protein